MNSYCYLFKIAIVYLLLIQTAYAKWIFVSPDGDDINSGTLLQAPMQTIQHALQIAFPGDTVILLDGQYYQDIKTIRSGTQDAPIIITGTRKAIIKGKKSARIIEINHSYIELHGLSVNGQTGSGKELSDYHDKLVYIDGTKSSKEALTGIRLLGLRLEKAYGECLRLKGNVSQSEVAYTEINTCGLRDFHFNRGKKNGEAIYIGTAPEQLNIKAGGKKILDNSHNNWIHHNKLQPFGSECIDIKEGAQHNIVEYNYCTDLYDTKSGGISVRGNFNTIRYNYIGYTEGAGIRLGGDTPVDGINNRIYENTLQYNKAGALKIMRVPQKIICANKINQPESYKTVRLGKGIGITIEEQCNPDKLSIEH